MRRTSPTRHADCGDRHFAFVWASGLVGLLTLVGIVVYAFRRVYPPEIHRFVIGMVRPGFRVGAYVALMRDEYPPFRLEP